MSAFCCAHLSLFLRQLIAPNALLSDAAQISLNKLAVTHVLLGLGL